MQDASFLINKLKAKQKMKKLFFLLFFLPLLSLSQTTTTVAKLRAMATLPKSGTAYHVFSGSDTLLYKADYLSILADNGKTVLVTKSNVRMILHLPVHKSEQKVDPLAGLTVQQVKIIDSLVSLQVNSIRKDSVLLDGRDFFKEGNRVRVRKASY